MGIRARRNNFQRFFRTEVLSAILLLSCAVIALVVANSGWAAGYHKFWEMPLGLGSAERSFSLSLRHWINDGLMAVFFLLVGLEIKRELIAGELATPKKAALPIAAAIGGMVVPALIYLGFNPTGAPARGWGIPMATDIAFALGALALVAPRAPTAVKVFLAALAIVDDMGAVLVIALFYSGSLSWGALGPALMLIVGLVALNAAGVFKLWPYLLGGAVLWFFVHESGVHATIAGVALAMIIPGPAGLKTADATSPLVRLEQALVRFSAFIVMPIFALANAGVEIGGGIGAGGVAFGITAGLLIGKPVGITLASFLAVKLGLARLPEVMSWRMLHGAAWLGGIGFTMSLFVTMLAFEDEALINSAKVAILGASLVAGIIAAVVLNTGRPRNRERA